MATSINSIGDIAKEYATLSSKREMVLERGRLSAKLTLPAVLPPEGHNEQNSLYIPWQGHGARCCRNLSGRLITTMFPTELAFFEYGVAEYLRAQDPEMSQNWDTIRDGLRVIERSVTTYFDTRSWRVPCVNAAEALIVVGNVLQHKNKEGHLRNLRIDQYVVQRDYMGHVFNIITKETKTLATLPEDLAYHVRTAGLMSGHRDMPPDTPVDIFTKVTLREDKTWVQTQEVAGQLWADGQGEWPEDACPWVPLRMTALPGEDYGRGLVELTIGDWRSLEANYLNLIEIASAIAKIVPLVNPGGLTNIRDYTRAPNGVAIPGRDSDITFAQINKVAEVQFILSLIEMIERRLSFQFLLNSSVQRSGERVTAEEIRFMAHELEYAFGGTYSLLAEEWQLKIAKLVLHDLKKDPKFPKLSPALQPQIVTGVAAIGKNARLDSIDQFVQRAGSVNPKAVKDTSVLRLTAEASGLLASDVVKSDETLMEEQQAEEARALAEKAAPQIAAGVMPPGGAAVPPGPMGA